MKFSRSISKWISVGLVCFFILSCKDEIITEIHQDSDVESAEKFYSDLSEEDKSKVINNTINYYQFTESEKALIFIRKRISEHDPVAIRSVSTAEKVGIKIPLEK